MPTLPEDGDFETDGEEYRWMRDHKREMKADKYERNLEELKSTGVTFSHHRKMSRTIVIHGPGRWVYYWPSSNKWRKKGTDEVQHASSVRSMLKDAYGESIKYVPFGDYEGKTVYWLANNDPGYAEWMLEVADAEWLRDALEKHLA